MLAAVRVTLPRSGSDWPDLEARMRSYAAGDVDWRNARTAVYVFHAGDDVLDVAKDAYSLYQSENALGPGAFPSLKRMEEEVVGIGLSLLHAPEGARGNMTSGGTESIMLAVKTCRDEARARGVDTNGWRSSRRSRCTPPSTRPRTTSDCASCACRSRRTSAPTSARWPTRSRRRTLMLVGSAPCFPYGVIDPIEELADLALARGIWLHVDACVGGYFAPFARMNGVPVPPLRFEVPGVRSISADLHKYGYAAKGASTVFHRTEAQWQHQVFAFDDWPAGGMMTPTVGRHAPRRRHRLGLGRAPLPRRRRLPREGAPGRRDAREADERRSTRWTASHARRAAARPLHLRRDDLDPFAIWARMVKRGWFTGLCTEPRGIHLMLSPAHAQRRGPVPGRSRASLREVRAQRRERRGREGELRLILRAKLLVIRITTAGGAFRR